MGVISVPDCSLEEGEEGGTVTGSAEHFPRQAAQSSVEKSQGVVLAWEQKAGVRGPQGHGKQGWARRALRGHVI